MARPRWSMCWIGTWLLPCAARTLIWVEIVVLVHRRGRVAPIGALAVLLIAQEALTLILGPRQVR